MFKWIKEIRQNARLKYNVDNNKSTKILATRIHNKNKNSKIDKIILKCKFCKKELLNSDNPRITKSERKQRKIIGYKCPKCNKYLNKFEYWEC